MHLVQCRFILIDIILFTIHLKVVNDEMEQGSSSKMERGSNSKPNRESSSKMEKYTAHCICDGCEQFIQKTVMIPKIKCRSIKCPGCKCSNKPDSLISQGGMNIHL